MHTWSRHCCWQGCPEMATMDVAVLTILLLGRAEGSPATGQSQGNSILVALSTPQPACRCCRQHAEATRACIRLCQFFHLTSKMLARLFARTRRAYIGRLMQAGSTSCVSTVQMSFQPQFWATQDMVPPEIPSNVGFRRTFWLSSAIR